MAVLQKTPVTCSRVVVVVVVVVVEVEVEVEVNNIHTRKTTLTLFRMEQKGTLPGFPL